MATLKTRRKAKRGKPRSEEEAALRATLSRQGSGMLKRINALAGNLRSDDLERASYEVAMAQYALARLGATLAQLQKLQK
jgi:CHASE3 domain sensor protein